MMVVVGPMLVASVGAMEVMFPTMVMIPIRTLAAMGITAVIAIVGIVMAVYIPMEMVGPVKPRSCTDENAIGKPLGSVVTEWSAAVPFCGDGNRKLVRDLGAFPQCDNVIEFIACSLRWRRRLRLTEETSVSRFVVHGECSMQNKTELHVLRVQAVLLTLLMPALLHAQAGAPVRDLPDAPQPMLAQAQNPQQPPASQQPPAQQPSNAPSGQTPAPSSSSQEPSLSDLGFSQQQTQGNPKLQARLNKRTEMLKIHQRLGMITLAPMAAALITGPMAKAKGRNGQTITEPTNANLDFHAALGGATAAMYFATAYFAIAAPKIPNNPKHGAIRFHEALAFVHGPGMILTPIFGALAFQQEQNGEKVHGAASLHGPVAIATVCAYGAAIVAVSWPIHLKFWEKK